MTPRSLLLIAVGPLLVSGCFLDSPLGAADPDAGSGFDAGRLDAGASEVDASADDAGALDAGPDVPRTDAGSFGPDTGPDGEDAGDPPPDDDAGPPPVDAGPDAGPPPVPDAGPIDCAVLYMPLPGASYNIEVCGPSDSDVCRINFDSEANCNEVCRGNCIEAHDNINKGTQVCSPRSDDAECDDTFNNAICTCSRP